MLPTDEKLLPLLSRAQIIDYLKSNFVTIQGRVYRDPITKLLYLGDRAMAGTVPYAGAAVTQPFTPAVSQSIVNLRGLGLVLEEGEKPYASTLRTLAMVQKIEMGKQVHSSGIRYEYVFMRGVPENDTLNIYTFASSEDRTLFHWLQSSEKPKRPTDCSIRGAVHFTKYSHGGVYPQESVVRRSAVRGRLNFTWKEVDDYAQKTFNKPLLSCVTRVLDAIIEGKCTPGIA